MLPRFKDLLGETQIAPRVCRLSLPEAMAREARARGPVEPVIPFAYFPAPPGLRVLKREILQAFYSLRRAIGRR